jgi:hypothetical protein
VHGAVVPVGLEAATLGGVVAAEAQGFGPADVEVEDLADLRKQAAPEDGEQLLGLGAEVGYSDVAAHLDVVAHRVPAEIDVGDAAVVRRPRPPQLDQAAAVGSGDQVGYHQHRCVAGARETIRVGGTVGAGS